MFGGKIVCSDKMYNLQNTCPVDTWLLIFKTTLLVLKMYNGTTQNAATKFTSFNQKGPF